MQVFLKELFLILPKISGFFSFYDTSIEESLKKKIIHFATEYLMQEKQICEIYTLYEMTSVNPVPNRF